MSMMVLALGAWLFGGVSTAANSKTSKEAAEVTAEAIEAETADAEVQQASNPKPQKTDPDPAPSPSRPSDKGPTTCEEYGNNSGGPYDHDNCDGGAGDHGNGGNGKCAGCTGKADDKYPGGQAKNDHNNGYECDNNGGVGKGNPAHSQCRPPTTPPTSPPPTSPPPTCPPGNPQCPTTPPPTCPTPQGNTPCPTPPPPSTTAPPNIPPTVLPTMIDNEPTGDVEGEPDDVLPLHLRPKNPGAVLPFTGGPGADKPTVVFLLIAAAVLMISGFITMYKAE